MGRQPAGERPLPLQPRTVKGTDDGLWHRARMAALAEHQTIGEWLNQAIAEKLEGRGTMKEQITVHGILPGMAYSDLKDARQNFERTFSTHVPTWRGLQNAIRIARNLHNDYSCTHGNGAAHRIRITAVGFTGTEQYWSEMAGATKGDLTREAVISYNAWSAQHEMDEAIRYEAEDRARNAADSTAYPPATDAD